MQNLTKKLMLAVTLITALAALLGAGSTLIREAKAFAEVVLQRSA